MAMTSYKGNDVSRSTSDTGGRRSSVVAFLTVIVILLLLVAVALGIYTYLQNRDARQMQHELTVEKDSISQNLEQVLVDYNTLETDNAGLRQKLDEEKARAEQLLGEIKQVKQVSFSKIKEYQRELGTLRAIMRKMVGEIDSLNTLNRNLIEENTRIRTEYTESQQNVERLSSKNEEMAETIQRGAVIKARNIELLGLNSRDKVVKRAARTQKLRVCMTLMENAIPRPGARSVIVRITGPDGLLLADPDNGTFELNGGSQPYSASREIDYQNADVDVCLYYGESGGFSKGKYQVEIYVDGALSGTGEALLK